MVMHCKYQRNNNKTAYNSIKLHCKQLNNAIQVTYSLNFFCVLTWVSFTLSSAIQSSTFETKQVYRGIFAFCRPIMCVHVGREREFYSFFLSVTIDGIILMKTNRETCVFHYN